ncbi:TPA: DUF805 domain-containing protein [Vibrio cholerae]|uniref:DUF805 domain-containing protein n=1 Tax=Vibrio cholerae TaxID=666 RepID=UPI001B82F93E|nr:DUF805 domain-containing protein [Vibrio cholerae]HDZ9254516.1 DUF805 domain-containing protein [Vibrio cholerae]
MTPLLTAYLQAWKQYFDFSGQTTRDDFWWFMLTHLLVTLTVIGVEIATNNPGWLDLFYSLISFIPILAILVRRLHDTQRSGWWAWVFVIPVIGPFWLIYLLVQPSSSHFTDKALLS